MNNMTKQKKSFLNRIVSSDSDEEKEIETTNENEADNGDTDENNSENKKIDKEWLSGKEDDINEEGQLTVDVYKTKELIVVKSIIGGVRPENLDISVTSDMVTIKGKRENPDNVVADDYYYQECFWGNFSRSIILPSDIKTEGVEATIKNGILTVKLPKIEKNASMKVKVRNEE